MESNQMSLIEIAEELMKRKRKPQAFKKIFQEVCEIKGINGTDNPNFVSQFYLDLTTSAQFIYTGDETWDLKNRQPIELWDKDGSHYNEYSEVVIPDGIKLDKKPEEVVKVKEVVYDPIVDDISEEGTSKKGKTPTLASSVTLDETNNFEEYDEDQYNEYMDAFEDMYDDN